MPAGEREWENGKYLVGDEFGVRIVSAICTGRVFGHGRNREVGNVAHARERLSPEPEGVQRCQVLVVLELARGEALYGNR